MEQEPAGRYKVISADDTLNGGFYFWLLSMGLRCTAIRFFSNLPHARYSIHVDQEASAMRNCTFMNFQYGGEGSELIWYKPIGLPTTITNIFGGRIDTWEPSKVIEVHRASLGFPSLVNAGVPHTMVNGSKHRYCYSLDISIMKGNRRLDWDSAMRIFSGFIIPE
jgi:hypothetical protein